MSAPIAHRNVLPVTVGTAGHIDHGKTTLLRALAGGESDTDRLSEERERGLTIDVGYAELDLGDGVEVGVVDVPGHEKFIRNMVAGATGIDVVLLVVAADDGVMPQTREHLQIMSLLGLRSGVIAITKADTVDEEMVELVRSDVEDLVVGTFLEGARSVPVSAVDRRGLDDLRTELSRLVRASQPRDATGFFRMPILRVFTSKGFGTVVTGIPTSGTLSVGDRVAVLPEERAGRVRGLQVYHRPAEEASAGHRTAINLADVEYRSVRRGDVVCAPGVFSASAAFDVKLRLLTTLPRPLRHNQEVRLHLGTLECAARVLLIGERHLEPGASGWAQLKLDRNAVAAPGDPFILRASSHVATLGGGTILGAGDLKQRRRRARLLPEFELRERGLSDPVVAVEAQLRAARLNGVQERDIVARLMRPAPEVREHLAALQESGVAVEIRPRLLIHAESLASGRDALLEALDGFHTKQPLAIGMKKALLPAKVRGSIGVVDGLLEQLAAEGQVETLSEGRVRRAGGGAQLSTKQEERRDAILEALAADPWQTPRANELPRLVHGLDAEVEQLLAILEFDGRIARLRDGVVLLSETVAEAQELIRRHCAEHSTLSPSDLKRLTGMTRKYSIPFLEHLDAIGFTRRQGDKRVLRA